MPSVEELLSIAEFDTDTRSTMDSRIEIDADTRIIQMMPQNELFGVESDEKSEKKYFKVPKIVGNGVDLSKLQLRINYQNASRIPSGKDMYIVTDATVYNDEWVYFSWELSRKVTQYKGNIYFVVCAVKADSKGNITNEWNTTLAEGKVLEGLEVEISQEQQYQASDYLEQLKQQLLDYSKEIKETFPSDYIAMSEDVKNLKGNVQKLDDNKITKFYTNNNGDTALNDSDDGKIHDLMIYGKSEQAQYTGKNLLNSEGNGYQQSGVTLTKNKDGTYTLDGKPTAGAWWTLCRMSLDAGQYKITGIEEGTALVHIVVQINNINYGAVNKQGQIVTIPDNSEYEYAIWIEGTGETYNNVILKPMITKDLTATYDDFEPYVGGKPSPSPEYPQEIKAVVNPVIKTHGKNLIDITNASKCTNVVSSVVNGRINIKKSNAEWSSSYIGKFLYTEGDMITISVDTMEYGRIALSSKATATPDAAMILTDKGGSTLNIINPGTTRVHLKLKYSGIVYVRFCTDVGKAKEFSFRIQVEKNNTVTDWQPYQESQATLPYELNAIPVSSGGNVTIDGQQYIADYVDVENGKIVKCVQKGFLKSFQWLKAVNNGVVRFYASMFDALGINNNKIVIDAPAISSHFILVTRTPDRTGTFILNADGTNANIGFAFSTDTTISSDEFNNWILKNKPFVFIQVLKEEIPLTSEQIQVFKALVTYYPKTYVTTESEQLNAYTMFNYPVSMEKGWEYVKQQIGDTRKYVYDMDTKLTETEASTLEAKIDTAILSEMVGG